MRTSPHDRVAGVVQLNVQFYAGQSSPELTERAVEDVRVSHGWIRSTGIVADVVRDSRVVDESVRDSHVADDNVSVDDEAVAIQLDASTPIQSSTSQDQEVNILRDAPTPVCK